MLAKMPLEFVAKLAAFSLVARVRLQTNGAVGCSPKTKPEDSYVVLFGYDIFSYWGS